MEILLQSRGWSLVSDCEATFTEDAYVAECWGQTAEGSKQATLYHFSPVVTVALSGTVRVECQSHLPPQVTFLLSIESDLLRDHCTLAFRM